MAKEDRQADGREPVVAERVQESRILIEKRQRRRITERAGLMK